MLLCDRMRFGFVCLTFQLYGKCEHNCVYLLVGTAHTYKHESTVVVTKAKV